MSTSSFDFTPVIFMYNQIQYHFSIKLRVTTDGTQFKEQDDGAEQEMAGAAQEQLITMEGLDIMDDDVKEVGMLHFMFALMTQFDLSFYSQFLLFLVMISFVKL